VTLTPKSTPAGMCPSPEAVPAGVSHSPACDGLPEAARGEGAGRVLRVGAASAVDLMKDEGTMAPQDTELAEALRRHESEDAAAAAVMREARQRLPFLYATAVVTALMQGANYIFSASAGVRAFGFLAIIAACALTYWTWIVAREPRMQIASLDSRPLCVPCPICKAEPGSECHRFVLLGLAGPVVHEARRNAYGVARETARADQ
jgi:hypothetical protein